MNEINKIIIVGGGSAGWMTASILIKAFPKKQIILIESPDIPRIGVGESTYEGINYYLEYLGIDRSDFFKHTDANIKLAIKFKHFYKKENNEEFIYPFGYPILKDTVNGLEDWLIKKYCYPETPINEYVESYFPSALLVKNNKLSENFENFDTINSTALHFDAIKFSNWLKENYAIPRGVSNILKEVKEIKVGESGIDKLILSDGEEISGDLYIDCTGFKSLLLGQSIQEEFISYNDILPNNHAWATQLNYKDKNLELDNITKCTALNNGWCWNIPLWSRIGAGYVYSDQYVSHEEALKEFKEYLKNDLKVKRTEEDVESLKFNHIKMKVGIHKKVWSKNVVGIGLAAGFIEPLESNGLFTIHEFLFDLVRALLREKTGQFEKDTFNSTVKFKYDNFVEFIRLHYALSLRDDSQYWQNNLSKKYDLNSVKYHLFEQTHLLQSKNVKSFATELPLIGGLSWICSGMNYFLRDEVSLRLGEISNNLKYKYFFKNAFEFLDKRKLEWDLWAKKQKSTSDFLKDKYYSV